MVSIAIPTYEMGIYGTKFMEKSLEFISKQTYKNFEIVISDHSIDNKIQKLVESCESNFNIRYFKNADKIGNSSSNLNFALRQCERKIVKILFQDEFLYDKDALKKNCQFFRIKS